MTRIGVIGARRQRQGLGPFIVRDLLSAGAEVPCFLATSAATRDSAREELAERWGVAVRGFVDLGEMLREAPVDALAICSPPETHLPYLEAALAAGLHVLCEKPFLWNAPAMAETTRRIVDGFEDRQLLLMENCQWPHTLAAFGELHPGCLAPTDAASETAAAGIDLAEFEMRMQPGSRGLQMLGDALPHALSLLQTLAPDPRPQLEELGFSNPDPDADVLEVGFFYRTARVRPRVRVRLERAQSYPREAGYAINGRWAHRAVDPETYRLSFADGGRSVPVADPLGLLIADFVARIRGDAGGGVPTREIVIRMQLLESIVAAYVALAGKNP